MDRVIIIVIAILVIVLLALDLTGVISFSPGFGVSASSCESALDKISDERVLSNKDINSLRRCSNTEVEGFILGGGVESSICTDPDADIDENRVIDVADVIVLLQNWGCMPSERNCPTNNRADINRDDIVDVGDIIELLRNWGAFRYCVGDINEDGFIDFRDLSIMQDEWLMEGVSDLNEDGVVDDIDLGILIYEWDEKEGEGECGDMEIPNTVGGCTEIFCDSGDSEGFVDRENEFVKFEVFGETYSVEGLSGSYSVEIDLASEEIVVEDRVGEKRIPIIKSLEPESGGVKFLAGGDEIINVTYNKTSGLGGLFDSLITAKLFCYDLSLEGEPIYDDDSSVASVQWNQNRETVRTEQLVIDEDYSSYDKCHIRLNEFNTDYDTRDAVLISLIADVASEVYFSDVGLIEGGEVFNSLKEQIPDNEKVVSYSINFDSARSFNEGVCGIVNDFTLFTNGHPDFEEIFVYSIFTRKIHDLKPFYGHKEGYLAQAWKGLPLERDETLEIQSVLYNPAIRGRPSHINAGFFVLNLGYRGGIDSDQFAILSFLPDPFTRKTRVTTFNELEQGENRDKDYQIRSEPLIGFLQRYSDMDVELDSLDGKVPVGVKLLEYFDDFVRQSFIEFGYKVYGYLYDVDRSERFRANYILNEFGELNFELGLISTTDPEFTRFYGTGLNILNCQRPQGSNPDVGACVDGVYTFRHNYVEEFGEDFVGEDCVESIGGILTDASCPD